MKWGRKKSQNNGQTPSEDIDTLGREQTTENEGRPYWETHAWRKRKTQRMCERETVKGRDRDGYTPQASSKATNSCSRVICSVVCIFEWINVLFNLFEDHNFFNSSIFWFYWSLCFQPSLGRPSSLFAIPWLSYSWVVIVAAFITAVFYCVVEHVCLFDICCFFTPGWKANCPLGIMITISTWLYSTHYQHRETDT